MIAEQTTEYRATLIPDRDFCSSREDDNMGRMVCWHRSYNLGDEQPSKSPSEWMDSLIYDLVDTDDVELIPDEHKRRILEKYIVILPLNLYDHSGITMSTSSFRCPWDSGQVGWIYCTLKDVRDNWLMPDATWDTLVPWYKDEEVTLREAAKRNLEAEVETYDCELTGEVYGFNLEERAVELDLFGDKVYGEWEDTDSCWGFHGRDVDKNGMAEHMPNEEAVKALRAADIKYD